MVTLNWISQHAETVRIYGEERACVNCEHFVQHYIKKSEYRFMPITMGHCTKPRQKDRCAGDCCAYFRPRQSGRTNPEE